MAPRRWWWVVFVLCPGVQNVVVRQKLDVANIKYHMQRELHACFFENLSGTLLLGREGWDDAGV